MEEGNSNTETSGAEARIRALVAEKKQLEAQLAEARELATGADKWKQKYEEAQSTYKSEREAARLERDILAAGVTDAEGIEYVQHAYSKLPAEGRPPLAEWLGNRDALPRAVKAYLAEPASVAPGASQGPSSTPAPTPAPTPMPRSNTGAVTASQPAPTAWSAEAISKLTPAEFKANRDAIMASILTP
jgi:hypothetical protein